MQFDFSGQTAVVTGGTRGIGKAAALALLHAGAQVLCVYGGDDAAAQAFAAQAGNGVRVCKLDVADHDACQAFWRELEEQGTTVDVLVNNAGIRRDNVLAMMPRADWDRVLDVNLGGVFNMSKYAVQAMSGKRYGRIINLTSPSGRVGFEGQANYAASKAGMVALTKSLARETARRGITVNCVSPGFIETELIADLPEEQRKAYKASVPAKRFGTPDDVANAILFLASKETAYITGAVLEVTGGL